ncbi:Orexin receptor type 2 [Mactra antiquata]
MDKTIAENSKFGVVIDLQILSIIFCRAYLVWSLTCRVSVFVSVLTLMAISVERYMAICHPLFHQGNQFKTRLIILIIWIISLITPMCDFYNKVLIPDEDVPAHLRPWMTACAPYDNNMEMEFNLFVAVAFYLLPLIVMSFTYLMIAICLWSSTSARNAISQNLQYESAMEQLKLRRRTARMLIVVVIMFGICYFPINALNIIRYQTSLTNLSNAALICIFWTSRFLCYFNSAINPVIYNFMSVKFRKQFKTACFGCYKHCGCFDRKENGECTSCVSRTCVHTEQLRTTTFGNMEMKMRMLDHTSHA